MRVSNDFHDWEFECRCGCGKNNIGAGVVNILQRVRNYYGKPVTISSAVRCLAYNRKPVSEGGPGSNDRSQHPRRTAVDFNVRGVAPEQVQDLIDKWYPNSLGLGRYDNFTHVDTRKGKARW